MAKRKTREELEAIKNQYNVDDIYSWSRYNLSKTDMYSYYLRYIKRIKEDRADSIYSYAGSLVHDLMEEFYNGNLKKEELAEIYIDKMFEFEIAGYKFNRNDEDANTATADKYNYCNKHYLENFEPIIGENIKLEEYVLIKVGKFLFNGYSDFEYEKDGKKHIVDFKTSTLYTGSKVDKEKGQLLLYALGKTQEGWAIEDIVAGWLFTKYVAIDVPMKDGVRRRNIGRHEIGSKLSSSVKSQLKKVPMYNQDEIDSLINELIETNEVSEIIPIEVQVEMGDVQVKKDGSLKVAYINKYRKQLEKCAKFNDKDIEIMLSELAITNDLSCLPTEVSSLYRIYDCFVEVDITQEELDELKETIISQIVKIHKLTAEYNKNKDDKIFYEEITRDKEFFFNILSGYSPKLHKPYREYLEAKELDKSDDDIDDDINSLLSELGLDI